MFSARILGLTQLHGAAAVVNPQHKDGVTELRRLFIPRDTNQNNNSHSTRTHLHVPTIAEADSYFDFLNHNTQGRMRRDMFKYMYAFSMTDQQLHQNLGFGDFQGTRSANRFDDISINEGNKALSYMFLYLRSKSMLNPSSYTEMIGHASFRDWINWVMAFKYRDEDGIRMSLSDYFMKWKDFDFADKVFLMRHGNPFNVHSGWSQKAGVWVHGLLFLRMKHAIDPNFDPLISDVFRRIFHLHGTDMRYPDADEYGTANKRRIIETFTIDPYCLLRINPQPYIRTEDILFVRSIGFDMLNGDHPSAMKVSGLIGGENGFSMNALKYVPMVRTGRESRSRVDFPVRMRDDDIVYLMYSGEVECSAQGNRLIDPVLQFTEAKMLTCTLRLDGILLKSRLKSRIIFRHYDATFQGGMFHVRYKCAEFGSTKSKIGRVNLVDADPLNPQIGVQLDRHICCSEITASLGVAVMQMMRSAVRHSLNYYKFGIGCEEEHGSFTVNPNAIMSPFGNVVNHIATMKRSESFSHVTWTRLSLVYLSLTFNASAPMLLALLVMSLEPRIRSTRRGNMYLDFDYLTDRMMWHLATNWDFLFLELNPIGFAAAWDSIRKASDIINVQRGVYDTPPAHVRPISLSDAKDLVTEGRPVDSIYVKKVNMMMIRSVEEIEGIVSGGNVALDDSRAYNARCL